PSPAAVQPYPGVVSRLTLAAYLQSFPSAFPQPDPAVSQLSPVAIAKPALAVSEPASAVSQLSSTACSRPSLVVISQSSSADVSQPRRRGRPPGPRTAAGDLTRPLSTRVAKMTEV